MLTTTLLLFGAVLLALALADLPMRDRPLAPAVVYLGVGWLAGALLGAPGTDDIEAQAGLLVVVTEIAVLLSLFAVGLRLRVPPTLRGWSAAWLLAGPGLVVAVLLGAWAATWLLGLPWPAALLLAAILSPTDPVLASEVRIHSNEDRDAVRLSLSAEGGLNDGTALPAVMLALGMMGLHTLGPYASRWWAQDLLWAIGGGALLGIALGRLCGHLLKARIERGDTLARDELLYVGLVALAYGLARATSTSSFIAVFAAGATLLWPFHEQTLEQGGHALSQRMGSFGARIERLVEAATVLAVGVALYGVKPDVPALLFGLALALAVRPLSVLAVVRRKAVTRTQRRLVAWFGIRGVGTLFYLAFAIEHGVAGGVAAELTRATLVAVALSILLHGVSATPLMTAYQRRRPPA